MVHSAGDCLPRIADSSKSGEGWLQPDMFTSRNSRATCTSGKSGTDARNGPAAVPTHDECELGGAAAVCRGVEVQRLSGNWVHTFEWCEHNIPFGILYDPVGECVATI